MPRGLALRSTEPCNSGNDMQRTHLGSSKCTYLAQLEWVNAGHLSIVRALAARAGRLKRLSKRSQSFSLAFSEFLSRPLTLRASICKQSTSFLRVPVSRGLLRLAFVHCSFRENCCCRSSRRTYFLAACLRQSFIRLNYKLHVIVATSTLILHGSNGIE